jgi:hypothetical protein
MAMGYGKYFWYGHTNEYDPSAFVGIHSGNAQKGELICSQLIEIYAKKMGCA